MHHHTPFFPIVTLICLCGALCLATPTDSCAEAFRALQWEIEADKLTKFEHPASIIAEGNVVLTKIENVSGTVKKETDGGDWDDLLGKDTPVSQAVKGDRLAAPKAVPLVREHINLPGSSVTDVDESVEPEKEGEQVVIKSAVITTIKADWMVYDMDLGTLKVRSHVLINIGQDQLSATDGVVNLNRETGTFNNASILRQFKDMHVEGRVIEKTGDLTYHIEDGWLITCKLKNGEAPPWSFHAVDTTITDGGYALLKHATFRIKDIPVFYTPIMLLPAKRNRQTGFLFPAVSLSNQDGFNMEWPIFINLSPSSDLTLYPHYFANRGFMAGAEMRYMLDQDSRGLIMGSFLDDALSDINNPDNAEYYADGGYRHTNQKRYWFRGKADQKFGDWTTRLDFDIVSDLDYLNEFNNGMTGFNVSDRRFSEQFSRGLQDKNLYERENKLTTLRSWSNGTSLEVTLRGIDDLLEEERTDTTPLWKLPEIQYSGLMPLYDTGLNFSWDADYVYYKRDQGVEAQRIDLHPKVTTAVPMLSEYLETTVGIGVRDTMYAIDDNGVEEWRDTDGENRFLADFNAEVATTLRKDFVVGGENISAWSHMARPFVQYMYITDADQEDYPKFDDVDWIEDKNSITYGVNNFFYVSELKDNQEIERDYGYIKLRQSYDLRSKASDEPLSPIEFRLAWSPFEMFNLKYMTDIDMYEGGFQRHTIESAYLNGRGDLFALDYLFNASEDENMDDTSSIRLAARMGLAYNIAVGYSLEQSIEDSVTIGEKINLIYSPSCWSVELAADVTPDNEQVTIMFKLANIGTPFGVDLMSVGE